MATYKARYTNGVLKPLEEAGLKEGEEVVFMKEDSALFARPAKEMSLDEAREILWRTSGAWADTIDCEKLERDIYESRISGSRPAPEL